MLAKTINAALKMAQRANSPKAKTKCVALWIFVNPFHVRSEKAFWFELEWLGVLVGMMKDAPTALINNPIRGGRILLLVPDVGEEDRAFFERESLVLIVGHCNVR